MEKDEFMLKAKTIMGEDFKVNIVDGKMVIQPSEAGIALFSHIDISEQSHETAKLYTNTLEDLLEKVRSDNANLRNLMELLVEKIDDTELVDEILKTIYPISAVDDEGKEVKFVGE